MDPILQAACDDADAICACLGPLAAMTMQANRSTKDFCSIAVGGKSEEAKEAGRRLLNEYAEQLGKVREQLAAVLEDFGDFFNGGDACTLAMEALTEPVYDMLRKRREGVSLDK